MAESAVDRYKKALEQAEAIRMSAVDEMKKEITARIEDLNAFGFHFRLAEGNSSISHSKKRAASVKPKHCGICNMAGHDKRNHRNQVPIKKFSITDLKERGLIAA
jgi:hypothetical protein